MGGRLALALLVFVLPACADAPTPPASADVPDTLEVRCDGETTEALTPSVRARSDGVHLVIRNSTDRELLMQWDSGGDGVGPGETTIRLPILPGSSRFRCLPMSDDLDPGIEGGWARFEVLAPEGWVSPELDCPSGGYGGAVDYVPGARGVQDPLGDARATFRDPGTVLEAGYSTADSRSFINVVDGVPTDSLTYVSDGHEGWLQSESSGCSD
jgi:hypothetical protein